MAHDLHQYGDPMRVLERKQEYEARKIKGCLGCQHYKAIVFNGEKLHSCVVKRWIVQNCNQYQKLTK